MKRIFAKLKFYIFAAVLLVIYTISAAAAEPVIAPAQNYIIDTSHSYIEWHISHFGFSYPSGKWFITGNLELNKTQPENNKVNVTIPMDKIATGIPELDEHLKKAAFFDVSKFPTASFTSQKIEIVKENKAKVYGLLTLHGMSKSVMLKVKLNKIGLNPINHKESVGFSGITELKRSDFGINAYLPGLSDKVKINIQLEASKAV